MGQDLDLICNICAMLKVLQLYDMVISEKSDEDLEKIILISYPGS